MTEQPPKRKAHSWGDTIRFILITLAIVIPLRAYVAEPFIVSGHSMDPTFRDNEYLIIDRLSYKLGNPNRGDVVVFRYPKNPNIYYIKRIIGLPNETVTLADGKTTITKANGTAVILDESFVTNKDAGTIHMKTTLGPTEYFVLGDNRPVSADSRVWGPLDASFIVGKPAISLFPLSTIGWKPGNHQFAQ